MSIIRNIDLKNTNRLRVLNVVKDETPISRANIATKLKLSRSTVSLIIEELIEEGWIEELGLGESTGRGGKRPILLQIKKESAYVIAVSITSNYADIAITNLFGDMLINKRITFLEIREYETHFDEMIEVINELLEDCIKKIGQMTIMGCGIVVRGLVDVDKNLILYSAKFKGWNNVPIGDYFSKRLNTPVFVENDIRSITSLEYEEFKNNKPKVLMCINAESGIALGVAINGNVFYGSHFGVSATHSILDVNGPLCSCGNQGCWDTIASIDILISEVEKRKKLKNRISYVQLLKMYESEDADVIYVLKNYTGYWMSIGVLNALNNYNPDTLVLLGEIFESFQEVRDIVVDAVNKMPNKITKKVKIITNDRKKNLLLMSSSNLVISNFFSKKHHDVMAENIFRSRL